MDLVTQEAKLRLKEDGAHSLLSILKMALRDFILKVDNDEAECKGNHHSSVSFRGSIRKQLGGNVDRLEVGFWAEDLCCR